MPSNICYYVHHHGAGHITRAIAIAKALLIKQNSVTFIGSNLHPYREQIPAAVTCLNLPLDVPTIKDQDVYNRPLSFLHYAPLNVGGQLGRVAMLTAYFKDNPTTVLVVDVSVEICVLARLCGIPTVVIRQHGYRDDLPHRMAYESAERIIAPYPAFLAASETEEQLCGSKLVYSGGFSRFTSSANTYSQHLSDGDLAVFIGQGGSRIDLRFIRFLREQLPEHCHLHILGDLKDKPSHLPNTIFYGHHDHPEEVLASCTTVICNAGHNTIMELADLGKRMICIPAERPFEEQMVKARALEKSECALYVGEEDVFAVDWNTVISRAQNIRMDRVASLTDAQATATIAEVLMEVYDDIFCSANVLKKGLYAS